MTLNQTITRIEVAIKAIRNDRTRELAEDQLSLLKATGATRVDYLAFLEDVKGV